MLGRVHGRTQTIRAHDLRQLLPYAASLLFVAAVSAALLFVRHHLDVLNVALLFLIAITLCALRVAIWPSIVASVAAFLAFDFLFVPPYYTFSVARPDDVLALFVFLGLAILVSQLVVRARTRTEEALRRGRQTSTLYDLSTALIGEIGLDDTLAAIASRVRRVFALDTCAILLAADHDLVPRGTIGEPLDLTDRNVLGLAAWVLEKRQMAGLSTGRAHLKPPGPPGQKLQWSFARGNRERPLLLLPIATTRRPLGVLVVARQRGRPHFDTEEGQLLETFANQAAIAIERGLLTEEQTRAEVLARSDELKSALLSAVSHDLRTPLASIKASVTSLLQPDVTWPDEDRRDLLNAINEEADRLNRLVANLLDLSRVEAGELRPEADWYDLSEVIYRAVDLTETALRDHPLEVDIADGIPPLRLDFVMIVQVLVNLLENAAKYSSPGERILLTARQADDALEVAVRDEGISLPAGEEDRIFDKFYRVESPRRPLGSGIGLAICRGFIMAHGGRIWAERNGGRGTTIHFTLPLPVPDEALAAAAGEATSERAVQ